VIYDETLDVWSFSLFFENVTEASLAEINCYKFSFDNIFSVAPEVFIIHLIRRNFCAILKVSAFSLSAATYSYRFDQ